MKRKHFCLATFLFIISYISYGQKDSYDMSTPLDLNQKGGWNKVLCMKNGNTMLFHLEPAKKILVKVFDSLHKEVGSQEERYKVLDILHIELAVFKGLYDINGESVLFIDQDYMGKHQLIRMQYDSKTGKMLDEEVVRESKSENKRVKFYVMKNKQDDGYAIFFFMDVRHPVKENVMSVVYYNNKHEVVKDVPLTVTDRKQYEYVDVVGAEMKPEGVLVTISLSKTDIWGTANRKGAYNPKDAEYENNLEFFYIPVNGDHAMPNLVKWTTGVFPDYSWFTYNPFANTNNLLLYSHNPIAYQFGMVGQTGSLSLTAFFKLDEQERNVGVNVVKHTFANKYLKQRTDTNRIFDGVPTCMVTDDNGLTTIISTTYKQYGEPETRVRYNYEDYIGNIGITQLDDNGNELWGAVLPLSQYFKSYKHYYDEVGRPKWPQTEFIFGDLPAQIYNRQFLSVNTVYKNKNFYIIYNDHNNNFLKNLENPGDTIYDYSATNACYYKFDKKKELTKNYLFGEPADNEFKTSFIEGADFDEKRGTYATLVQYKRHDNISLRMAWVKLD